MKYKIIKKLFGQLLNKPCWNIRRDQWKSAISFEFGKPSLKIYERHNKDSRKKPLLTRRTMVLTGAWHIMFDGCSWKAYLNGEKIGDNNSKEVSDKIAHVFSGQALKDVIIKSKTGESIFIFDLGGRFETHPYDDGDQWNLRTPSGKYLSYRADGKYSFEPGDKPTRETAWKEFTV